MNLRSGLGLYWADNAEIANGHLTLHDLAELINRAGWGVAGVTVQSEYKVNLDLGRGKLDWVWLDRITKRPLVAFEIEGRDVNTASLDRDFEKFVAAGAQMNVVALFQVDHNHAPKGPKREVDRCFRNWIRQNPERGAKLYGRLEVWNDCDLMAPDGIEKLQRLATTLSASA